MIKLISVIGLISFFSDPAKAQEGMAVAMVRYTFVHVMDTTQRATPFQENMALFIGKSATCYISYDALMRRGTFKSLNNSSSAFNKQVPEDGKPAVSGSAKTDGISEVPLPAFDRIFYTNAYYLYTKKMKLFHINFAGGTLFSIEEPSPSIKWEISQEFKEIQGLKCQKATCSFKGRNYQAWFSPDIAYPNGPWKLNGLPGLILEAFDDKKEVQFLFAGFTADETMKFSTLIPDGVVKTTSVDFKRYEEATKKNRDASRGNGIGGLFKADGQLIVSPDGKIVKSLKMNNPIELK